MDSISKKLTYLEFLQRENDFHHHTRADEQLQYRYLKEGDLRSVEETHRIFTSNGIGHLSDDPVRNYQYCLCCSVTLATRAAIEAGMDEKDAYNASDLYIQTADKMKSVEEIIKINEDMVEFFTRRVMQIKKEAHSKPIKKTVDYIYNNLYRTIASTELSKETGLNYSYLSTLFKKETGLTVSGYIEKKRMEAAENMLTFSDYSLSEIGEILAFSSYSHFAKVFRKHHGMSPKQYRLIDNSCGAASPRL